METKEVLQLLQYYDHNFMNELQVVQGYISMQKTDKAYEKINECVSSFQKRRELISTKSPLFALWIIRFNMVQTNIRLTYQINTNKTLQAIDQKLVKNCDHLTNSIIEYGDNKELYEVIIDLKDRSPSVTVLMLTVNGKFSSQVDIFKNMQSSKQNNLLIKNKTESVFTCEFSYSI